MHFKKLLDPTIFIGPQDCSPDKSVVISRVVREKLPERDGDKGASEAPMMYFSHNGQELPRKYKVPKSVLYGMSLAYGPETDAWIGQTVVLFAAKCSSFGEIEECVRIRFAPEIDARIRKWMKKRKASVSAYIIEPKE